MTCGDMPLKHKDRLSAVDASFLAQEGPSSHMHVGGVLIFEGPPPKYHELLEQINSRLHLVPRFRQKLAFPPYETGRPIWVDDPNFNLEYHVRHTALPEHGPEEQLKQLTGRIFSQQLDRTKPLWEVWLVQGLDQSQFALVSKTHHAMVDGISGVDLTAVLFDPDPVPKPIKGPEQQWVPHPEPTGAEMAIDGIRDRLKQPLAAAQRLINAVEHPRPALKRASESAEALAEVIWALLNPAPDTPLNVEIGPHRRYHWIRCELEQFKQIKNAVGGTVNDAVLAVVAGALARFFRRRGQRTEGLELRGLVPVSIRSEDEHGELGNRIAAMRGPLPLYADDPLQRLLIVHRAMDGLKESKQALGAEVIAGMNDFMPPTILSQASRLQFSTRLFNLIVTNVPGPQFPIYMLGRELRDLFPVAFLPKNHALAVAIMSYNGRMGFGFLADYDALPDAERLRKDTEDSLAEMLEATRKRVGMGRAGQQRGRVAGRGTPTAGRTIASGDGRRGRPGKDAEKKDTAYKARKNGGKSKRQASKSPGSSDE